MTIRFQRLTTVYPSFVDQVLQKDRDHLRLPFCELYERFASERFAESDFHAVHLRRLGYEAENHFTSIKPLQEKWAQEHGAAYRQRHWFADIAIAQVNSFQPNVLFLDDLFAMGGELRQRLRQVCRNRPYLVGWRVAPVKDFGKFADLDLMLSSIPSLVAEFRQAGIRAEHLHHGFEASMLEAVETPSQRDIDFAFAGGLGSIHRRRLEVLAALQDRTPLQIWGHDHQVRWKDRIRAYLSSKQHIDSRYLANRQPGRVHPSAYGQAYYEILARSKVCLNVHIDCNSRDASAMRLFEATGMGACLLTDEQPNLGRLFEVGTEVVTYRDIDDCAEKVAYLLENDDERMAIAAAGQRRTLVDHTFGSRVEQLAALLEESLDRVAA